MNEIRTWQQGRYSPEGRDGLSPDERRANDEFERHLVRPTVRGNAICRCPKPEDAIWIANRLNLASKLEKMTYDFETEVVNMTPNKRLTMDEINLSRERLCMAASVMVDAEYMRELLDLAEYAILHRVNK